LSASGADGAAVVGGTRVGADLEGGDLRGNAHRVRVLAAQARICRVVGVGDAVPTPAVTHLRGSRHLSRRTPSFGPVLPWRASSTAGTICLMDDTNLATA
jgi:hypothetical protein